MRTPTREEWNRQKAERQEAAQKPGGGATEKEKLPGDLFLPDDYVPPKPAPKALKSAPNPGERQFVKFDEAWRERLISADPPVSEMVWRLAVTLLAEADFHRVIVINEDFTAAARLSDRRKRGALERLEQLGLARVEWYGRGKEPRVTPLHLARRRRRQQAIGR